MADVKTRDMDRGWAWVVLAAASLSLALQQGLYISVGIFQVEFMEHFSGSQGFIALICSVTVSIPMLLGPVVGVLTEMLTHGRTVQIGGALLSVALLCASFSTDLTSLFVLFGLVSGLGYALSYTPSVTVVSTYFCKYRIAAHGVTLSAPGVGILAAPYLLRWLITDYGWRIAMASYSCFTAQICVLGALMYPQEARSGTWCCRPRQKPKSTEELDVSLSRINKNDRRESRELEVIGVSTTSIQALEMGGVTENLQPVSLRQRVIKLACRRFLWIMCLNQFLLMLGCSVHIIIFPAYAKTIGLSEHIPSMYTLLGVAYIVCRASCGLVFNNYPQHLLKMLFCLQVAFSLVVILLPLYGVTLPALIVGSFLFGATYSTCFMLVAPILVQYLGLQNLPVAFGIVLLFSGLGYLVGAPIAGAMHDVFGSYHAPYYIGGSAIGIGALTLLLLLFDKGLQPSEKTTTKTNTLLSDNCKEDGQTSDAEASTDTTDLNQRIEASVHTENDDMNLHSEFSECGVR